MRREDLPGDRTGPAGIRLAFPVEVDFRRGAPLQVPGSRRHRRPESRIYELPLDTWTAVAGSKLTVRHALRAVWDLVTIARR